MNEELKECVKQIKEAATRLSELLQPLESAYNRLPDKPLQGMTISEKMKIAELLILATNPNNTRTNTNIIIDDYEEDCPVNKEIGINLYDMVRELPIDCLLEKRIEK